MIDLAAADAALTPASSVAAPRGHEGSDRPLRQGRAQPDSSSSSRASTPPAPPGRPGSLDLSSLKTLPPIMYPQTMLNMAVNYREHALEMGGADTSPAGPGAALPGTKSAPGIWERQAGDTRWNPYLFTKLPSAVIAAGRVDPVARRPHADRLGVRARRRHRRAGFASGRGPGARLHLRLHDRKRRVGSRRPRRHASRQRLADCQVPRHLRADGPVHRARRSSCPIRRS